MTTFVEAFRAHRKALAALGADPNSDEVLEQAHRVASLKDPDGARAFGRWTPVKMKAAGR